MDGQGHLLGAINPEGLDWGSSGVDVDIAGPSGALRSVRWTRPEASRQVAAQCRHRQDAR